MKKEIFPLRTPRFWTPEKVEELRRMYADTPNSELAAHFGSTANAIVGIAYRLGFKKSEEFLRAMGQRPNAGHFKPGLEVWNKGKKGLCFPGSEKGHFPKNNLPPNTKSDGHIAVRFDKAERPYLVIRIAKKKWKYVSRWVFEKYYGEVPPNMVVRHKNNNRFDFRLENLELVSRKQNRVMNAGHYNLPDKYVANTLIPKRTPKEERERLRENYAAHPELLELKRNLLKLKRLCKTT